MRFRRQCSCIGQPTIFISFFFSFLISSDSLHYEITSQANRESGREGERGQEGEGCLGNTCWNHFTLVCGVYWFVMWRIELTRLARQGVACGHVHVVIVLAVVRQVIAIRVSIGSGLIWINRGWFCKNRDASQVVVSGGCVRCECTCCGVGRFLPYRRRLRLD